MEMVDKMKMLPEEQSMNVKKQLAQKMNVEDRIMNWSNLSGEAPLWDLIEFQNIYEDLLVINAKGKNLLLQKVSEFLSGQHVSVFMFPADGYIESFDFEGLSSDVLRSCPIIEIAVADLKKTRNPSKWIIPEDVYFFDDKFSWMLFLCHERFEVLCGKREFVSAFKEYWIDSRNYIDEKWSEIFAP